MVAQFTATIQTEITYSYTDFDGTQVDVVTMTYPNGFSETRQCWTEETLDIPNFCLKTSSGTIVKTSQHKTRNNKWLTAYQSLYYDRAQARVNELYERDFTEQDEIELERAYQLAKADLGFGW